MKQDFVAMAQIITDQVKKVFDGEEVTDKIFYAPSILMTKDNIE